ncbi:hypothetical protein Ahy_A03g016975 isoform A [Arachis hypogaea]|uniref:Uncharacterized protein n=1 Tax=Arachis hypogaea TaxID=3818 RepID=A0A445E4X5_ARAHY|nr:hypothetical protein Ahy_A03g016975 isoform A [Arachis hypogaea]
MEKIHGPGELCWAVLFKQIILVAKKERSSPKNGNPPSHHVPVQVSPFSNFNFTLQALSALLWLPDWVGSIASEFRKQFWITSQKVMH